MRQIIALGGGGFSMESDNPTLDLYVLAQTRKRRLSPPVRQTVAWQRRPWVLTEEGRHSRLGETLNCVICDEPKTGEEGLK